MEENRFFVPVGFKFVPSDQQLLEDYLYKKVSGIPIPYVNCIVKECELYGNQEPRQIWESNRGNLLNEDDDLYFFTKLKKTTTKSSRIDRKIGSGCWQGEDAPKNILSKSQKLIGSKKRFRYENQGSEDDGCWIMHEYTLHAAFLGKNQSTHYVLCRIRWNGIRTGKKKKLGLGKKRKLQDFQNSNQSVENMNHVECPSSEASIFADMIIKQSFQTREAGGIDYSCVAVAGQYNVPHETIQTLTTVQSAEPEKMMTHQQNQQSTFVNDLDRPYDEDDQLRRICDDDRCMLRKLFDKDPIGESVDWVSMPFMKEMLSDLPEILSEEIFCVPCDDGESAGSTSCSVDRMMKEQNLSDPGGKGIHQRTESVSDVSMPFPGQTLVSEIPQFVPDENVVSPIASVELGTIQYMSKLPQLCELPNLPSEETILALPMEKLPQGVDRATTMNEMQVLTVLENHGSICSSLCLDCRPFDPLFLVGEDFF